MLSILSVSQHKAFDQFIYQEDTKHTSLKDHYPKVLPSGCLYLGEVLILIIKSDIDQKCGTSKSIHNGSYYIDESKHVSVQVLVHNQGNV